MTGSLERLLQRLGRQDWIRYGVRDRVIRALRPPDAGRSVPFETEFFGYRYAGNLNSYIDWVVFFYGAYEKYELFLMRDLLGDAADPVFLDVGANVGHHSLFMSRHCQVVHAFEPYPRVRTEMEARLRQNGVENVVVHPVGLGDRDLELDYFAPQGSNIGTGSFLASYATDNNRRLGKLPVVHADTEIARLQLPRLDLIKIDVEGFEKNVLAGLSRTLHDHRPAVFMEFSAATRKSFSDEAELRAMLPEGYRIQQVVTCQPHHLVLCSPGYRLVPFDFDRPETNLVFLPG